MDLFINVCVSKAGRKDIDSSKDAKLPEGNFYHKQLKRKRRQENNNTEVKPLKCNS